MCIRGMYSTRRERLCKLHCNKKCSLSSFYMAHLHNGDVQLKLRRKRYSLRSLNSTLRRVSRIMPYLSLIAYVFFFGGLIFFSILDLKTSIFSIGGFLHPSHSNEVHRTERKCFCIVEYSSGEGGVPWYDFVDIMGFCCLVFCSTGIICGKFFSRWDFPNPIQHTVFQH